MRALIPALFALALPAAAAAADADVQALMRHFDRLYRADNSSAEMVMRVVTPDFERELRLESWSEGTSSTLIRIKSPRKERGTSTLKRGNEMWNYLPKIRRTIRIPPSMMMGSWMGSDFTNDDLMRDSSWEKDYDTARSPKSPAGQLCVDSIPKADAAVTWSKVVTCFDVAAKLPLGQSFYDEKQRLARTLTFDEPKDFGGPTLPSRMVLEPKLKSGHRTVVTYLRLEFDVKHPPNLFSITRLRRGR